MTDEKKWFAGAQVPQRIYEAIAELVKTGKYLNESDFVRQAIIDKLKREGALNES